MVLPLNFNTDIIRQIILSLRDDKTSLFSCLLINQTWCSQTIDILWRQPFRLLYSCAAQEEDENTCNCSYLKHQRQAINLIDTYILSIFRENEQRLIAGSFIQRGQLPKLKFDYADYLRNIDIHEMDLAIIEFYFLNRLTFTLQENNKDSQVTQTTTDDSAPPPINYGESIKYLAKSYGPTLLKKLQNTNSEYQIISEVLLKFFMRKCRNLQRISLDINQIFKKTIFNRCNEIQRYPTALLYMGNGREDLEPKSIEIYFFIPKQPNARDCLSHIRELICTTKSCKADFFLTISKYVHKLDKLEIDIDFSYNVKYYGVARDYFSLKREVASLIKLIHNQQNLSHLILHHCPIDFHLIMEELREFQAERLKVLNLIGMKFNDMKVLFHVTSILSLQKLQLHNCTFQINELYDVDYFREKLYLPELNKIDLNNSYIPHQFLQCLLQICSSNLEYLDIGKTSFTNPIFNPIEFTSTNFSKIKYFKCDLQPFENNYLRTLLSNTIDNIQSIILDNSNVSFETNNIGLCLYQLSGMEFVKLKYFGIRGNFIFSEFTLSNFLVNKLRKFRGLKLHTLEFINNNWFTDEYLKQILKCLEDDDGFTCNRLIIHTKYLSDNNIEYTNYKVEEFIDIFQEQLELKSQDPNIFEYARDNKAVKLSQSLDKAEIKIILSELSGNNYILIHEFQFQATSGVRILEWIEYDRFYDVERLGFGIVHKAEWKDGFITSWIRNSQGGWGRYTDKKEINVNKNINRWF
ncbi:8087_t:CDS:2 [Funneliformis geosporum]|uniref:8087_t:CDS:1 n=1 Tax=Funneliformis geosporum TaxID=1117311 RepID=A0A9W4SN98_9GLOM|nr:8087_t:CDS:2 [Funneliformis geosporum]